MKLEDINLRDPIKIGYYDPFSAFSSIKDDFSANFPLSNLHWRYNPLKPVKSIPLLPVRLVEEVPSLHAKNTSEISLPLDNVYARLMVVKSTDIDTYRSQVRPLIIEWLKSLVKPQNVLWAIILVNPAGKRDKKSSIIKMSIFDKLNMDFGHDGKQLLVLDIRQEEEISPAHPRKQVLKVYEDYPDEISKLEVYNEVVGILKLLVLCTFDKRYMDSTRAIEKLKLTSKSNPADKIELLQEEMRLASTFNDMRCLDESLDLYETLYAELIHLGSGEASSTSIPTVLKNIDYTNFQPESITNEIDPYYQFCRAVEQRAPIDMFAVRLGLFAKISILLQMLANFATSISISSIYMSSLLQKATAFLNEVSQSSLDSIKKDQWLYAMADFYLNLPLARKLVELDKAQAEAGDGISNTSGILEYTAELKLLKRLLLSKFGKTQGFESPTNYVFLESVPIEPSENPKTDTHDLAVRELAESLKDQTAFEDSFASLTISAIEDFANCERIKTIDVLSIDLAMLHFKKREYKEALDILQTSYDYFIENGWNYLGGVLLEVFLECILHVKPENSTELMNTTLELFVSLNDCKGAPLGINDYNLIKNKSERLKLFHRLKSISESLDVYHESQLDRVFKVEVLPHIDMNADDGRYYIQVKIQNKFGIEIDLLKVVVTFVSADDLSDISIPFTNTDISLSGEGYTLINLSTNLYYSESLKLDKISVEMTDKLVFSTMIDACPTDGDHTVIHHTTTEEVSPRLPSPKSVTIQMFPFPELFRVEIMSPKAVSLGTNALECVVHNGPKDIENLAISIATSTHGLQLSDNSEQFNRDRLGAGKQMNLTFHCNTGVKIVGIKVTCHYEIDGERYEYHFQDSHDLSLKVSVSVQDIFRTESIYSKFQIGCVNSHNPVRIRKCDYKCTQQKFDVKRLSTIDKENLSLMAFGEQPAFVFYKVTPITRNFDSSDALDFMIQFSDLESECKQIVRAAIQLELKKRGKLKYMFMLTGILSELHFDLIQYSVENTVHVLNAASCSKYMNEIISRLIPPKDRSDISDVLLLILHDGQIIGPLDLLLDALRELHISVPVPCLNTLHHVEFIVAEKGPYILGEPINTRLVVKSNSKWSGLLSNELLASSSPDRRLQRDLKAFELTVINEEDWLISGCKRQNIYIDSGEAINSFDVCLIPLNAGELLLPKVTMKAINDESGTMDVIQENGLETLSVIAKLENVAFTF